MIYKSKKESTILIIKQEGDCFSIACVYCPLYSEKVCGGPFFIRYKAAVNYYIKKYGKEDLLEQLI